MKLMCFYSFIISLFLLSCTDEVVYEYPNNNNITNINGMPKKRGLSYFPVSWFIDSSTQNHSNGIIDSVNLKLFSKALAKVGEPILYNYYTGIQVVRLTWIRPKHPFLVLSVENIDNKLYLKENGYESVNEIVKSSTGKDSTIIEKRIYQRKLIDYQNMVKIKKLIKKNKINDMSPTKYSSSCEGAKFVIEIHQRTNYHLVFRCISNEIEEPELMELCNLIINLRKS